MMRNFFTSVKDTIAAAVVDRSDVSEAKRNWGTVQRFFQQAHQATDEDVLEDLRQHLPLQDERLQRVCVVLAEEAAEAAPGNRPFFNFVFRARMSGSDAGTMFVHSCQFAKANHPPGSRAVALRFLSGLLAAADGFLLTGARRMDDEFSESSATHVHHSAPRLGPLGAPTPDGAGEGYPLMDGEAVAVPLMDAVAVCLRDLPATLTAPPGSDGSAERTALADLLAQLCHYAHQRPALERLLAPRGFHQRAEKGASSFLVTSVESLIDGTPRHQCPATAAAALRGLVSLAMVPATADNAAFTAAVAGCCQRTTKQVVGLLTSFFVTLCKIPDNTDFAPQTHLCLAFTRFIDGLLVCAPATAAACSVESELRDAFLASAVAPMLAAINDRSFSVAAALVSLQLQSTVSKAFHRSVARCLYEPKQAGALLHRAMETTSEEGFDVADSVANVALSLLTHSIERAPDVALAMLLNEPASPLRETPNAVPAFGGKPNIDGAFPAELAKRGAVCGVTADEFARAASERVMRIDSRLLGLPAFSDAADPTHRVSEAPIVKAACARVSGALSQSLDVNSAATGLLLTLTALPDLAVGATLCAAKGPLMAALAPVRSGVSQRLATAEMRTAYARLLAAPADDVAALHVTPQGDEASAVRLATACVAIETFRHELNACWSARLVASSQLKL